MSLVRRAFAALGALIDRATRWAFPLTSFELDQLTDDTAREGKP